MNTQSRDSTQSPLIQVQGLTAGYNGQNILENIHFCVYPGEILVILGGSGCGKSTLLKHMIGLYKPVAGRVLLWGTDLNEADDRVREQILKRVGGSLSHAAAEFRRVAVLVSGKLNHLELDANDKVDFFTAEGGILVKGEGDVLGQGHGAEQGS